MLITEIKPKSEILEKIKGKILFIQCHGCKEIHLPTEEINKFLQELDSGSIVDNITTDYLCNPEYTKSRVETWQKKIDEADVVIIFSCGVGVQVFSELVSKFVFPGCNTIYIDGFSGTVPSEYDCAQCGDCLLSFTGGICPVTACSKGLVNGPCGGAKDGKCEVDKEMDCGWERIIKRLESIKQLDNIKQIKLRDHSKQM